MLRSIPLWYSFEDDRRFSSCLADFALLYSKNGSMHRTIAGYLSIFVTSRPRFLVLGSIIQAIAQTSAGTRSDSAVCRRGEYQPKDEQ